MAAITENKSVQEICKKSFGIVDFVKTEKGADFYTINTGKLEADRSHVIVHRSGDPTIMFSNGETAEDPYRRQNMMAFVVVQLFRNYYFAQNSGKMPLETWQFSNSSKTMQVEHYSFSNEYLNTLKDVVQAYGSVSMVQKAQNFHDDENAITLDIPASEHIVVFKESYEDGLVDLSVEKKAMNTK